MNKEIDSTLELPYKLIDIIGMSDERFVLTFKSFKKGQNEHSIQKFGVTGDFEIIYKCNGMESTLECDITPGNLYYFYIELDTAYDIQFCRNSVAALENYYNGMSRTKLMFKFNKHAHCFVNGNFKNKCNGYRSGISFDDFEIDLMYVSETLFSLDKFISELKRIQGHSNFY